MLTEPVYIIAIVAIVAIVYGRPFRGEASLERVRVETQPISEVANENCSPNAETTGTCADDVVAPAKVTPKKKKRA